MPTWEVVLYPTRHLGPKDAQAGAGQAPREGEQSASFKTMTTAGRIENAQAEIINQQLAISRADGT